MPPLLGLAPGFVTASTLTCLLAPGFLSLPMRLVPALRFLPGAPSLDRDLRLLIGPREGSLPLHPPLLQRQRFLGHRREGLPRLAKLLVDDPQLDGRALGDAITTAYFAAFGFTLSAVDLGLAPDLADALDQLASAMMATGQAPRLLQDGAAEAQDFADGAGHNRDLGDILDHLTRSDAADDQVLAAIDAAREVYTRHVLANVSWDFYYADATGVSIYAPVDQPPAEGYQDGTWSDEHLWDDFLDAAWGVDP